MKKKYIVPSMMVVKVSTMTMLAASITGTSVDGLGASGDTSSNDITEGASRSGGFWDDEE